MFSSMGNKLTKTFVPATAFEPIPDASAFLTSRRRLSFELLGCFADYCYSEVICACHCQQAKRARLEKAFAD